MNKMTNKQRPEGGEKGRDGGRGRGGVRVRRLWLEPRGQKWQIQRKSVMVIYKIKNLNFRAKILGFGNNVDYLPS